MKKIPSLFVRSFEGERRITREINPVAQWVADGEGVATRKFDGTCCMIRDGKLYKRYDAKIFTIGKNGEKQMYNRKPPVDFEPAQELDQNTGHQPGWLPVTDSPQDKWFNSVSIEGLEDGTYELCGPKIGNNAEGFDNHILIPHGKEILADCPRTYDEIKEYLKNKTIEGIVWHRGNGDMVKIKRRDFDYSEGK